MAERGETSPLIFVMERMIQVGIDTPKSEDGTLLDRIKKLCKKRGISVSALENKLDLPNNTIYQWKSRTPRIHTLRLVADYFNVSIDYLLGADFFDKPVDYFTTSEQSKLDDSQLGSLGASDMLGSHMITIGSRIRSLREARGLSMKSLSEKITEATGTKISSGQISDWENGHKNPSSDGLIALSKFFTVSVDWILRGENAPSLIEEQCVVMTPFDRLKFLCNSRGISVNKLEEKLKLSRNTLYSWKRNTPVGRNLMKVADYFGVSTDYILGRNDNNGQTQASHLEYDLNNYLQNQNVTFRGISLTEKDRSLIMEYLKILFSDRSN